MAARMGNPDAVFRVEIDQDKDDPVPVMAVQPKPAERRTIDS